MFFTAQVYERVDMATQATATARTLQHQCVFGSQKKHTDTPPGYPTQRKKKAACIFQENTAETGEDQSDDPHFQSVRSAKNEFTMVQFGPLLWLQARGLACP